PRPARSGRARGGGARPPAGAAHARRAARPTPPTRRPPRRRVRRGARAAAPRRAAGGARADRRRGAVDRRRGRGPVPRRARCDPDVMRRLRRASLAALRKEVEPVEQVAFARFLPHWHGIDRRATLREGLVPLQGLALPVSLWESEVLPRRIPGYQPAQLDALCASGEVVWVGAGLDRVAVFFRDDAAVLGRPAAAAPPEGEAHDALRAALNGRAEFW